MTRDELEHAIRAACDVADDTEIYVFGSHAILGQHPDPPEALRQSAEVDVMPKNKPDAVDRIDGALGELSQFHQTFGFYVHSVSLETAVLPEGWEDRLIKVCNENTRQRTGWCVESQLRACAACRGAHRGPHAGGSHSRSGRFARSTRTPDHLGRGHVPGT